MSNPTYTQITEAQRKPIVWMHGEIKTPPFSKAARIEAGTLLGRLQGGDLLEMPHSRPMPSIGARCHELRIRDKNTSWRVIYRIDTDAIVVVEVFAKTARQTPKGIVSVCRARLAAYDSTVSMQKRGKL